jgi:predicted membrane protein
MGKKALLVHCVTGTVFALALLAAVSIVRPHVDIIPLTVVLAYLGALPATALVLRRREPLRRNERGRGFTIV